MSASSSRYRLLSSLGKGGMGEVFLADDTQLGRKVAIKFVTEALEADPTARERLHREARSAAALDHPYICKIHEIAEVDGRTGVVMEHVSGETLQATLARGALSPQRALEIAGEIAEALDEAHTHRLVHRDLKPANVMLTEQGHVKVMDFGLAKAIESASGPLDNAETINPLTESGVRVGTPGYMAPEQLLGGQADARSDIFAFGILLYELLTGVHPFHRASQSGTMAAILRDAPAPVTQYQGTLPESAKSALDRLLVKEPERRHQSFADVRADLKRLFSEVSGVTSLPSVPAVASTIATTEATGPTRTPYVGRETERGEMRRLLNQAAEGRGATVLVGGEPGVGKTRFTEELLREARERNCLALVGHCYETEGQPPFIPFVEMLERASRIVERAVFRQALGDAAPEVAKIAPELRRVFPDIPAPVDLPPDQQRRFLFNAYQAFTERAVRAMPMVLVLEDLHWADEPTVLLMQHLAQHVVPLPLLLVGTYRDVELDVGRPWAEVLESLVRERLATRIALRRLPETDIEQMLGALGGPDPPPALARAVYHETEGNPFFVEEVFQHLKEEGRLFDDAGRWRSDLDTAEMQVPEGVRLVIGRRLKRVNDETRKALTVAAVIGRNFALSVLEAAVGIDADTLLDALEEAERAQLITSATSDRDASYIFSHELIRQTLRENLSLPRRQRLHLRVADAIEATSGDDSERHAAVLAHHGYQAGSLADADKTLRYLTIAGHRALAAAAFEDAVGHFTTALSFDRLDAKARADLLYERGGALRSLAQAEDAIADWQTALSAYEAAGDAAAVVRTAWDLGFSLLWQDRGRDAAAVAERAERVVPDDTPPERARALALLGGCRGWVGDYATLEQRMTEARLLAEPLGDQRLLGEVLGLQTIMYWMFLRVRRQVEVARDAVQALRAAGDVWELPNILTMLGFGLVLSEAPVEACRVADEAEQLAVRVGYDGAAGNARAIRMMATPMLNGDLDLLERSAQHAADGYGRVGPWSWVGLVGLSMSHFWRGRSEDADRYGDEALAVEPPETWGGWPHGWRFVLQAYRGDRTWLDTYRQRHDALYREGRIPFAGDAWGLLEAVEALAVLGEREDAHRLYGPIRDVLKDGVVHIMGGPTEMYAGIAAAAGAQWETAERHFETAARQADDLPHKVGQPEVRRWHAWMLLDRDGPGDLDRVRTLLDEAIQLYKTIGMPKHVEIAERMLTAPRP